MTDTQDFLDSTAGSATATEPHALEARAVQSAQISRSLTRLIGEVLYHKADLLQLTLGPDSTHGIISSGQAELKQFSLKTAWFDPIFRWISDRRQVLYGANDPGETDSVQSGCSAICLGDEFVTFKFKKLSGRAHETQLRLYDFRAHPFARLEDEFSVGESARPAFRRLISQSKGLTLVAGPDEENLQRAGAAMLAVLRANVAVQLTSALSYESVAELAAREPVIGLVCAEDAAEAMLKLAEFGGKDLPLNGALVLGFARKVCSSCARQTVPDRELMGRLPEVLRPVQEFAYMVGRGCTRCGNTGYSGVTCVMSVSAAGPEALNLLDQGADHAQLVSRLYPQGTVSMLEDGVRQIRAGRLTLESLFKLVRQVPASYLKEMQARAHKQALPDGAISVEQNFFEDGAQTNAQRPVTGSGAFTGHAAGGKDVHAPISGAGYVRTARARPLLLVVEDDPDQRSILEMVLKSANYDVRVAADGSEALKVLEQEPPDMVISDLMMPNIDGAQLVTRIRSDGRFASIPVLILTVVSDSDKEFTLLDLGADDYCEKTIQRKLLLKRVEKLLKRVS